jgi:hypothetical protein
MSSVIRGDDNFDTGVNGKLLQARTFSLAGSSTTTTQATWLDTGVSIAVTPVSTNSILLVHCSTSVGISTGSTHQRIDFRVIESGGTEVYRYDFLGRDGSGGGLITRNVGGSGVFVNSDLNAKTFKAQIQKAAGSSSETGSIYYRWYTGAVHTITVLEIDAS